MSTNLIGLPSTVACTGMGSLPRISPPSRSDQAAESDGNSFHRLIQITRSNDQLLDALAESQRRLAQARAYAGDPKSSAKLGAALVAFAKRRQTRISDQLRTNRREALVLLAGLAN